MTVDLNEKGTTIKYLHNFEQAKDNTTKELIFKKLTKWTTLKLSLFSPKYNIKRIKRQFTGRKYL